MSKRTHERVSGKRKKATAKADALRAVIEKPKLKTQSFKLPDGTTPEAATDPECQTRLGKILCFSFGPGAGVKNL